MTLNTYTCAATPSKANNSRELSDESCNIKVVVRCRPMNEAEEAGSSPSVIQCDTKNSSVIVSSYVRQKQSKRTYTFDNVLGVFADQESVFDTISSVVDEVLRGFNCTVFAYGQTGTGKTFTMQGPDMATEKANETLGIIPRSIHQIFDRLKALDSEIMVHISCLEIYNEVLVDLLSDEEREHRIFEDNEKGVFVSNLEEVLVTDPNGIFEVLSKSWERRVTGETKMNKMSSRSHTIFTVKVHIKDMTPDGEEIIKIGKLNLVDLAGSECVGRSEASGKRAKEAGNINRSLLTLGRVINALVQGLGHVPYRESKLTRLLQESLGGCAKTVLLATISPSRDSIDETVKTLEYAHTAKNILNKPAVNQKLTQKAFVRDLQNHVVSMKKQLEAQRLKSGVHLSNEFYANFLAETESLKNQLEDAKHNLSELKIEREKVKTINKQLRLDMEEQRLAAASIQEDLTRTFQTEHDNLLDKTQTAHSQLKLMNSDNTNLCEAIDRHFGVERDNVSAIGNVRAKIASTLSDVSAHITSFSTVQHKLTQEATEYTHCFLSSYKQLSNDMSSRFSKFTEDYSSISNKVLTDAGECVRATDKSIEQTSSVMKTMKKNLNDSHESLVVWMKDEAKEIVGALNAQDEIIQDFARDFESKLSALNTDMTNNATQLINMLENSQRHVIDTIDSTTSSLTSLDESIKQKVSVELKHELRNAIDAISKQIFNQIDSTSNSLSNDTTAIVSKLVESKRENQLKSDEVKQSITRAHADYSSSLTPFSNVKTALANGLHTTFNVTAEAVNSIAPSATKLLDTLRAQQYESEKTLQTHIDSFAAEAMNIKESVNDCMKNIDNHNMNLIRHNTLYSDDVETLTTSHCTEINDNLEKRTVSIQSFNEKQQSTFNDVSSAVMGFGWQNYDKTGNTPTKRIISISASPKRGRLWADELAQLREEQSRRGKRRRIEYDENTEPNNHNSEDEDGKTNSKIKQPMDTNCELTL